jgi:hypothetical protein
VTACSVHGDGLQCVVPAPHLGQHVRSYGSYLFAWWEPYDDADLWYLDLD